MSTLLIRLCGPMQSWGVQSRFAVRDTGLEPSKSGVIGLICAALGRRREEPLEDLNRLKMGVRVDQEGRLEMDYHTAQNILKAGGGIKETDISRRYYLADGRFLVGLEGEVELLRQIQAALQRPVWQLYLGRKAFVPSEPVWLEDGLLENASLEQGLRIYPYFGKKAPADGLRAVIEDEQGWLVRPDVPLSFAERRFATRRVKVIFLDVPPRRLYSGEVN